VRANRFTNSVLIASASGLILLAVLLAFQYQPGMPATSLALFYLVPLLVAALLLASLLLPAATRVNLVLLLFSSVLAVFGVELFLTLRLSPEPGRRAATAAGREFDGRSRFRVIQDLRGQGVTAYPDVHGRSIAHLRDGGRELVVHVDGEKLLPLSPALANSSVVLCNETGSWISYRSDEHGFRNPAGIWSSPHIEIAAIGDSFTLGVCRDAEDSFVGGIRSRWPATINLGLAGAGPLLELAILREYLPELRPRIVLWFFYEGNDIQDLHEEQGNELLLRYLEDDFLQHSRARQAQIDGQLREFLAARLQDAAAAESAPARDPRPRSRRMVAFAKLSELRAALGFSAGFLPPASAQTALRQVMEEAKSTVGSWGGELYVVYLPTYNRYGRSGQGDEFQGRRQVLATMQALGIPVIDLDATFRAQPDPTRLWDYPGAHYTVEGNQLIAQTVVATLDRTARRP
jgi:hypothetical protein